MFDLSHKVYYNYLVNSTAVVISIVVGCFIGFDVVVAVVGNVDVIVVGD